MKVIVITEAELSKIVVVDQAAVKTIENAFTWLARDKVSMPPIMNVEVREHRSDVDIKSAYGKGLARFAVKIGTGFFQNYKLSLPNSPAMMVVLSSRTGMAEAIPLDNAYLTDVRTDASEAAAAMYLAPMEVTTAGVIGGGAQGRYQTVDLKNVRDFKRLLIYGKDEQRPAQNVDEMGPALKAEVVAVGMLLGGIFAYFPLMFLTFFLTGLGRSTMDPAIQAYVSDRVPYDRRGMFIGLLEVSYAGSALIGIPLIAISIDQINWRAPFFIFSFVALIGFIIIRIKLDEDHYIHTDQTSYNLYRDLWKPVIKERSSLGMVVFFFFSCMASENIFVVYGPWLETGFGLNALALGLSTTVIGLAELCGAILSALSSDRIGLKRTIIVGQIIVLVS
jgi:hypothetical protein